MIKSEIGVLACANDQTVDVYCQWVAAQLARGM